MRPFQVWLTKDIAFVTEVIVEKIREENDFQKILGYDALNTFIMRTQQMFINLKGANERYTQAINDIDAKTKKKRRKLIEAIEKGAQKRIEQRINEFYKSKRHLIHLKKINYFFIEKFERILVRMG